MWGPLLAIVAGAAYGFFVPGRRDKPRLFWTALLVALAFALAVTFAALLVDRSPLGLGDADAFDLMLSFGVAAVAFLVGAWLGDLADTARSRRRAPIRRA